MIALNKYVILHVSLWFVLLSENNAAFHAISSLGIWEVGETSTPLSPEMRKEPSCRLKREK
jgi:hypothetical protein